MLDLPPDVVRTLARAAFAAAGDRLESRLRLSLVSRAWREALAGIDVRSSAVLLSVGTYPFVPPEHRAAMPLQRSSTMHTHQVRLYMGTVLASALAVPSAAPLRALRALVDSCMHLQDFFMRPAL